jgi:hypothetical protein
MNASQLVPRVTWAALPLLVLVLVAGCGSSTGSSPGGAAATAGAAESSASVAPEPTAQPDTADATPGTSLTACELVAPSDIEAVLGLDPGTVAEGTLKPVPATLDPAENQCRYDDQDWGGLVVQATPTKGASTFATVVKVYGDSGEPVDGVGDGGYWFEDNDRGYFLKGSVMIIVQFVSIADGTKFREPSIELGKAFVAKI